MNSSRYVGRVGGLAVALGVGAGFFSSLAIASADTGSQEASSPTSSATSSATPSDTSSSPGRAPVAVRGTRASTSTAMPRAAAARTGHGAAPKAAAESNTMNAASTASPAEVPPAEVPQRRSTARGERGAVSRAVWSVSAPADPAPAAVTAAVVGTDPGVVGALPAMPRASAATAVLSSVPDPNALAPQISLKVVGITAVSTTASFLAAVISQLGIAFHIGPSRSALNQTVSINGVNMVPSSTELVTSLYGPWTYAPGGLNILQGQQQYNVVDPGIQQTVGSFGALVSSGTPLGLGSYVELLVSSADGNVGTGAGQVPPVGSVIAHMKILGQFGWTYSAMPSQSGAVISVKLTTPLGDIPIPFYFNKFNAAQGIADHTVDNRPIDLGNGYNIAPSDPAAETYTGTSGLLPIFQTVQTRQQFDVRDSTGATVGTFEGVATTTWDVFGAYTEAILVTDSHGDNVGTGVGQVPPTGTVYNVSYEGSDANYDLYASMPSAAGDVISMIQGTATSVRNVLTFPVNRLDASAPPAVKRLPFGNGYGILPTSKFTPSGVNGLPPRDVQVQGYQQFGVYDPAGVQQGSFDAIATRQWDLMGISSEALIVTKVTDGTAGTPAGDIPPVGSVLNYVYFGNSGFGTSYWSLPSPSGTKISYKILTPIIDIPTWSTYNASAGIDTVTFADPLQLV